jgi:hypothetical protein
MYLFVITPGLNYLSQGQCLFTFKKSSYGIYFKPTALSEATGLGKRCLINYTNATTTNSS